MSSKHRLRSSAPTDAFAARGNQEQYVVIIPSKKLVIVTFGATSVRAAWDMDDFISRVTAAIPDKWGRRKGRGPEKLG